MATYIMLTRVSSSVITDPSTYDDLNSRISERLKAECPELTWTANYSVLGPYDYLDIFEAPDNDYAARVALLIRSFGHVTTEVWPAVSWNHFRRRSNSVAEVKDGGSRDVG
ncbi:MAG: GYD domain-containing protein [Deltaproteobacteria bacterium]|nr:GYD domain-containing protein [Deltaproteobacteria bacterium]